MNAEKYFSTPHTIAQKQYDALRLYFLDNLPAVEVAKKYGYTYRGFTTIVSDFRKKLKQFPEEDPFFTVKPKGRKPGNEMNKLKKTVIDFRKKNYSVGDIKVALDGKGVAVSEKAIYNILKADGFSRLPRRSTVDRRQLERPTLQAAKSRSLDFQAEDFKSSAAGILVFLPYRSEEHTSELQSRGHLVCRLL